MYRHGTPHLWTFRRNDVTDHGGNLNPNPAGPRCPDHPIWSPDPKRGRQPHRYRRFRPLAMSVTAFDRRFWRHQFPELAGKEEQDETALHAAKEKISIQPEQADKVAELTVSNLDLNADENSKNHHTTMYFRTVKPVLRRGQEFVINLTFDRDYQKDKDMIFFIFKADDECKGKNLYIEFQLDKDGSATYKTEGDWGSRILEKGNKTLKVEIYIPGDCVVGQWALEVKTSLLGQQDDFIYECQQPLFVLFNPWSAADQVHYNGDKKDLDEYVLNQMGAVFRGCAGFVKGSPWVYDQFKEGMLEICLSILRKAFGFKMSPGMADPVTVARALSRIINSNDNEGVLVGNWSGNYEGGTPPSQWDSSEEILREYVETERPVKYGQCWVFSHVLTAVCRAIGFPCRSVTNFSSAHDTDNTCTIDYFKDEEGNKVNMDDSNDSVWNFHVWNEVWILRNDLHCTTYDGWHVIDATPQEMSLGVFQCGPCPVEAIKRGDTTVGYDTGFVFSEVNADRVHWQVNKDGSVVLSRLEKDSVGESISTKIPDGLPYKPFGSPLDITNTYKNKEGSEEERRAVEKAVRFRRHGRALYKESTDLKVKFETGGALIVGEDLVLKVTVQNMAKEDKNITMLIAARTCRYWNLTRDDKHLAKETIPEKTIKVGQTENYEVTIPASAYMENLYDDMCLYAYACATDVTDVNNKMPYSADKSFVVTLPELEFQGPQCAKSGEPVTLTVSLTNSLSKPLTGMSLSFCGSLDLAPDDENINVKKYNRLYVMNLSAANVPPTKSCTVTLRLLGKREADDEECKKKLRFLFRCKEFPKTVESVYVLHVEAPVATQ